MTVRYDVTVAWALSPRVIAVAAPSTAITIQDLVDTIRYLEELQVDLSFDHLVNAGGKESLGENAYVGITVTLRNAKLAFEARPPPTFVQCKVSGGNLVAIDGAGNSMSPIQTTAYTQVVLAQSSSPTIVESGTSGLTPEESAQLAAIDPDLELIKSAVDVVDAKVVDVEKVVKDNQALILAT